jgi:hypothetical protein
VTARAVFKEIDITRAIRGARKAGVEEVKITIAPTGEIVIVTGRAAAEAADGNSFDKLMGKT